MEDARFDIVGDGVELFANGLGDLQRVLWVKAGPAGA